MQIVVARLSFLLKACSGFPPNMAQNSSTDDADMSDIDPSILLDEGGDISSTQPKSQKSQQKSLEK